MGLFKLNFDTGTIHFSNFASPEESISAEFAERNYTNRSDGALVVVGTGENKLCVLAFNSYLEPPCSSDYEYIIEIPNYPIIQYSIPMGVLQPMLCVENELIIFPESSSNSLTFEDGSQGYFLNPCSSGTYNVSYNDGCYIYTETVQVYVGSCMCPMYVPNAFTPNKDGLNEIFKPVINCPVYDYELLIFDRWGELIYTSQDINIGWAG